MVPFMPFHFLFFCEKTCGWSLRDFSFSKLSSAGTISVKHIRIMALDTVRRTQRSESSQRVKQTTKKGLQHILLFLIENQMTIKSLTSLMTIRLIQGLSSAINSLLVEDHLGWYLKVPRPYTIYQGHFQHLTILFQNLTVFHFSADAGQVNDASPFSLALNTSSPCWSLSQLATFSSVYSM